MFRLRLVNGCSCKGLDLDGHICTALGKQSSPLQVRFETELQDVRSKVEKVVGEMLVGSKGSTRISRALLSHVDILAAFLGRR